jgi:hypothetical protein
MRRILPAFAVLLMLGTLVPSAHAQATGFLSRVRPGDASLDQPLAPLDAAIAFLDANHNGKVDATDPDEPVYLDMDHDGTVGYADIRLTPFLHYPAGSLVGLSNRDLGFRLATASGWFAFSTTDAWYLDFDSSNSATVGDLRLSGTLFGTKVAVGNPDQGTPLSPAQAWQTPTSRVALRDANSNGLYDPGETVYLDMDANVPSGARKVSVDDARLTPSAMVVDKDLTRADVDQAIAAALPVAKTTTGTYTNTLGSSESWRLLDWFLVGLTVLNLVGLVAIVRRLNHNHRPPHNPFK